MGRRLAFFLLCTWLLTLGGHLYSGDEVMMARVTEALVTRGSLSPRPLEQFEDYARVEGRDRQSQTWYAIGPSLVAVPFYLVGGMLERWVSPEDLRAFEGPVLLFYDRNSPSEVVRSLAVSATNAFVMAILVWLLYWVVRRQGVPEGVALGVVAAFGLTGLIPFYARSFFSEPLGGLLWMAALAAWIRVRETGALAWALAAGLAVGALPLARVALGIGLPVAAAAIGLDLVRMAGSRHRRLLLATAAFLGAAISLGLWGGSNWVRFGHPLETGYSGVLGLFGGDFLDGLSGLLWSPGRGLIWYSPWVLLAAAAWARLARRDPALAIWSGGLLPALVLLYAPWAMWDGGWCFGPRFLVPALGPLVIPLAREVGRWWQNRAARWVLILGLAWSVWVAATSLLVNYLDYHFAIWATSTDPDQAIRWAPEWSPLWRYWVWPRKGFVILPRLLAGHGGIALATMAWSLVVAWLAAAGGLLHGIFQRGGSIDRRGTSR